MAREKIYRSYLTWLITICMAFFGIAWSGMTTLAAGGEETANAGVYAEGEEGESETGDSTDLITVTFDYGRNEDYLKNANYAVDKYTYTKSIQVPSGSSPAEIMKLENAPVLPTRGTEINKSNFRNWVYYDGYGEDSINYLENATYPVFDEDVTLTANWENTVTYNAKAGHFYNGSTSTSKTYYGSETILDTSLCCYPNTNDKAFIGWSLDGTVDKIVDDSLVVVQNFNLYAVYVDGYSVTFDVNLDGGSLYYYYESYRDSDGSPNYGEYRYLKSDDDTSLTLTYPKGVKPGDAPYFCCDPFKDTKSQLRQGENKVEFSNWSLDAQGTQAAYFGNLSPKADGTDTLYAVWSEYYVVTFDSNRESDSYQSSQNVIKGRSVSNIPYSSFDYNYYPDESDYYSDNYIKRECVSFNTKKDGTGEKVDSGYVPTDNITVYAQYKDVYDVRLDGNGGNIESYYNNFSVDQGEELKIGDYWRVTWPVDESAGEKISRKVFGSWNTKKDGTGTKVGTADASPFIPTSNVTLYAIPEDGVLVTFDTNAREDDDANVYGTVFNFRGSGNVTEATFAYSKTKPISDVPYLGYYVNDNTKQFAGWSTEYGNLSKVIDSSTFVPKEDMTLYAVWYDMVPVTYHANGGNFYSEGDTYTNYVIKGNRFNPYNTEKPSISKGYVLAGWAERAGSSNTIPYGTSCTANEPMDFYAVWEKGWVITLNGNGGSVEYYGGGHGHYDESNDATFTIKKGSVVFDMDDSEGESGHVSGYHEDGLILVGWSKEQNGTPIDLTTYIPKKDETFYAVWEEPWTVTYDPGDGTLDYGKVVTVPKGGCVSYLPTPTLDDKFFGGWFVNIGTDQEAAFDTNTVVDSDITVTAKWVDEKDTVTLNFDAGSGASFYYNNDYVQKCSIKVANGVNFDLYSINPSMSSSSSEDLIFGGWESKTYTWDGDYSNRYYKVNGDNSFTAIWKKTAYCEVTFDGNGGKVDTLDGDDLVDSVVFRVQRGSRINETVAAQKDGEEFTGWYFDKECTQLAATPEKISSYKVMNDITLYAGYKAKKVEVAVTGISLSKDKATIGVSDDKADSIDLEVLIYPANATNGNVTFVSSNNEVATVSSTGKVTAKKVGETVIKVTSEDGGFTAECKVTVTDITTEEISKKVEELNDIISNADTPEEAKEAVKTQIEGLGGVERLAELAAVDEAFAEKLASVEQAYVEKAGITVEDPAENAANVSVIQSVFGISNTDVKQSLGVSGAGLNAEAGETIGLAVNSVPADEEMKIDEKYENAKQVDINLTKTTSDGKEDVEELESPVTVTMPIPSGMIRSKLYILHFNEDGTYTLIRPTFKNNGMSFTVSHFSRFAFVEVAETISQSGETPTPTPTPAPTPTPTPTPTPAPTPTPTPTPSGTSTDGTTPTPTTGDTATPATQTVSDGAPVSEAGSTASYTVASAADKTVVYTGDTSASGKITVKSTITVGSDTYTVTSIADGAFKKSKVTAVTIPETVESIGKSAFEGASKLKTLTIKGSKLTTIGDNAFKGCASLTKVTLPKSVKKVGKNAFANCKKLKTITVKNKKIKFAKNSLKGVPKTAAIKLPKMTAKEKKAFKKMLKSAGFKGKVK